MQSVDSLGEGRTVGMARKGRQGRSRMAAPLRRRTYANARACVRAWIGKRRRELSPLHPRDWEGEEMGYPARPIASYDYFRKRGDPCMSCGVILETYCSLEVV